MTTRQWSLNLFAALLACIASANPALAATFLSPDFGTQVTPNILFGAGAVNNGSDTFDLLLDLYQPTFIGTPVPATSPAIVLIHGGSFVSGDKSDLSYLANIYASYGYRVASINYRLAGQAPPLEPGPGANATQFVPYPQAVPFINAAYQDAIKAMVWVRTNGAAYGVDTNRIAVGGYSAGAGTAVGEAYIDETFVPGYPAAARPQAVLDFMGGAAGGESVLVPNPNYAPAFIVHGTADSTAPYEWDLNLSKKLTQIGVYNELHTIQSGGHSLNMNTFNLLMPNGKTLLENNIIFLANHLVPEPSSFVLASLGLIGLVVWKRGEAIPGGIVQKVMAENP
jgi:acetyl esterase/lipase